MFIMDTKYIMIIRIPIKPFLVAIKNKHLIRVYSINNDVYFPPNQEKYPYYYNSLIGEYHPNRIFVGKSPKNATTIY